MKVLKLLDFVSKARVSINVALLGLVLFYTAISTLAYANVPKPPEEVFRLFANYNSKESKIEVHYKILPDYYLYRDKTTVKTAKAEDGYLIEPPIIPAGIIHNDDFFGETQIFKGQFSFSVPVQNLSAPIDLLVNVQGCADFGICYPPFEQLITVSSNGEIVEAGNSKESSFTKLKSLFDISEKSLNNISGDNASTVNDSAYTKQVSENSTTPAIAETFESESDALAREIAEKNLLTLIFIFFGLGLLLSLSPCTLPMVPILAALITGANKEAHPHVSAISTDKANDDEIDINQKTLSANTKTTKITKKAHQAKRKSFLLSVAFVLGTAITYATVGVIAGFTGSLLTTTLQLPAVQIGAAVIMVVLASACFGLFQLQMPEAVASFFRKNADKHSHGFIGILIAGVFSALLIGPCVAAPLIAILLYIGKSGSALVGATLLFILAIGQGIPLLAIGLFSDKIMPKLGRWMEAINQFFGFLLLLLALWIISPIISVFWQFVIYGLVIITWAVFLGAFTALSASSKVIYKINKVLSILMLIYGVSLIIGALSGSTSLLKPLQGGFQGAFSSQEKINYSKQLEWQKVTTIEEFEHALDEAKYKSSSAKPVLIKYNADWCISCKEFEAITLPQPKVQELLSKFTLIAVDVTDNNKQSSKLLGFYGLFGPPAFIFLDKGSEMREHRLIGVENTDNFINRLNKAIGKAIGESIGKN